MSNCRDCGELMEGDGYTFPVRCPNLSEEVWWYEAPDSGPWYCNFSDDDGQPSWEQEWADFGEGGLHE